MQRNSVLASFAAMAALLHTPAANAAANSTACISEAEVSGLAIYAMPSLLDGVGGICAEHLSPDGFLASNGVQLADNYTELSQSSWPLAKSGLMKFIGDDSGDLAMFAELPDEAVRPFVDAIIIQKITGEIKPGDCSRIERGIRILAPLPPENTGELIGFIMSMVKVKNPQICPSETP